MKPTMLFSIVMLTSIILMVAFGLNLSPDQSVAVSAAAAPNALYVCPTKSSIWDPLASGFAPFTKYIVIGFFFAVIMLLFSWGWAMYQNLLKDKFNRDSFKNPWALTKITFWAFVIVLLLVHTPNYYRRVQLTGVRGDWVLCESNTPGARPVRADAVHR
ncbi:MAG: hypothetical protein IJX89_00815 [Alphaproteobacteria bacterium]|nr:hypothetical protein [Alphaproteobacteria bacterium]